MWNVNFFYNISVVIKWLCSRFFSAKKWSVITTILTIFCQFEHPFFVDKLYFVKHVQQMDHAWLLIYFRLKHIFEQILSWSSFLFALFCVALNEEVFFSHFSEIDHGFYKHLEELLRISLSAFSLILLCGISLKYLCLENACVYNTSFSLFSRWTSAFTPMNEETMFYNW